MAVQNLIQKERISTLASKYSKKTLRPLASSIPTKAELHKTYNH